MYCNSIVGGMVCLCRLDAYVQVKFFSHVGAFS